MGKSLPDRLRASKISQKKRLTILTRCECLPEPAFLILPGVCADGTEPPDGVLVLTRGSNDLETSSTNVILTSERASRTICKSFVWSMVSKHALTSNLTKYSFGLSQCRRWTSARKRERTKHEQRLADVSSAETEFVLLQFLMYLIWSKDSVPGQVWPCRLWQTFQF